MVYRTYIATALLWVITLYGLTCPKSTIFHIVKSELISNKHFGTVNLLRSWKLQVLFIRYSERIRINNKSITRTRSYHICIIIAIAIESNNGWSNSKLLVVETISCLKTTCHCRLSRYCFFKIGFTYSNEQRVLLSKVCAARKWGRAVGKLGCFYERTIFVNTTVARCIR